MLIVAERIREASPGYAVPGLFRFMGNRIIRLQICSGEGWEIPMGSMKPTDFLKHAEEQRVLDEKLSWEGTFTEYLDQVEANTRIAALAHARLYDMIMQAGVEDPGDGAPREYKFFRSEIYGLDRTLQQLVEEDLNPASRRL